MEIPLALASTLAAAVLLAGCADTPSSPRVPARIQADVAGMAASYTFGAQVFDIGAAPDGSILVTQSVPGAGYSSRVLEIRKGGVQEVMVVGNDPGSTINGVAARGRGGMYVTSSGQDLAVGAGVWRVTRGGASRIADIHAFEVANDPDAALWKAPACETLAGYSAGAQSNPYHLTRLDGGTSLVGDAAGNSVLAVKDDGTVELVATLTPPVADGSASTDPPDWIPLGTATVNGSPVDCYAQPVATSVAVGPDGAYYVGELTGSSMAQPLGATGVSRVWRIEPGARDVVCPSAGCTIALSGLTSVIDLDFAPDGHLYVVEYALAGWLAPFVPGVPLDGDIQKCDVGAHTCNVVATLTLPSAIAFDKRGNPWVLTNNVGLDVDGDARPDGPTVTMMPL